MRIAKKEDVSAILKYLKEDVANCLYMYIDIGKYGIEDEFMDVWVDEKDGNISCVIMKYHTGLQVYSQTDDWNVDEVINIIKEQNVNSITACRRISDVLYDRLQETYEYDPGYVFEFTTYHPIEMDVKVERAGEEDMMEIAKLISTDEGIGSYYDIVDLANQLTERMNTGMGRNFIVRDGDEIVGHIASYAEFDGLATTSGLIVAPSHRSGLLGAYLEKYLVDDLIKDGFFVYTFITARLRKRLLESMGNKCVGEYGKLMKKEGVN